MTYLVIVMFHSRRTQEFSTYQFRRQMLKNVYAVYRPASIRTSFNSQRCRWIIVPIDTLLSALASTGMILGLRPINERRYYFVTTSLVGWAQAYNQLWSCYMLLVKFHTFVKFSEHSCDWNLGICTLARIPKYTKCIKCNLHNIQKFGT